MENIIGRTNEITELERLYSSGRAEFVAVYGRRRVGKTFLIKHLFKDRITFQHTGVSPVDSLSDKRRIVTQLESFYYSMLSHGLEGFDAPKTWLEAFYQLQQLLVRLDNGIDRQLIFIDELPWLDTPRSGFLSAFESFWNGWCSGRDNVMLVVCGSATSWILGNLSRSRGGLYGRLTYEIKLSPFTLRECEQYLTASGIALSRYDIAQCYMVFGGIPYYLSYLSPGLSFEQNVDRILFGKAPQLRGEFDRLFNASFINADECKKVIRLLASRHIGFTREEIANETGIPLGGGLSSTLTSLVESDFIMRYSPYGKKGRGELYKLCDNFCLFWIKRLAIGNDHESFMVDNATTDMMKSWRGVAFEELCMQHITQIKRALGIEGVYTTTSAWTASDDELRRGAQIDLLISRGDNVVNLCEMKFAGASYHINADEEMKLRNRVARLGETLKARQVVHLTMITTYGVAAGKHSGVVQKQVTLDDLFT